MALIEQCGAGLLAFIMFNMFENQLEPSPSKYRIFTSDEVEGFKQTGILYHQGQVFEPEEWTVIKAELLKRLAEYDPKDRK